MSGSDLGSKVLDRVKEDRGIMERLASIFPGYHGYKNKEKLRETDDVVRRTIYREMSEFTVQLRRHYQRLVRLSRRDLAREVERLYLRCDAVAQQILHAPRGYKPLAGAMRIGEADLEDLIKFDSSLADQIAELREKIYELGDAIGKGRMDDVESIIGEVELIIERLSGLMRERESLLEGAGEV